MYSSDEYYFSKIETNLFHSLVIFIAVGFGIEILNNGTVIVTFYDYVTIVLGSSWIWTFRIFFIVFLQAGAHLTLFSTRVGEQVMPSTLLLDHPVLKTLRHLCYYLISEARKKKKSHFPVFCYC